MGEKNEVADILRGDKLLMDTRCALTAMSSIMWRLLRKRDAYKLFGRVPHDALEAQEIIIVISSCTG